MLAKVNSRFWRRSRIGAGLSILTLLMLTLLMAALFAPPSIVQAEPFASPAFRRVWERADFPVIAQAVKRSWLYGPEGFYTAYEPYKDSPNGQRLVQYFDKARMEITNPSANSNNPYYVTNGLIVKEMILGNLQLGDETFSARYPAYAIPVAGDPDPVSNNEAPTYASFYLVASTQLNPNREAQPRTGEPIGETINKTGGIATNNVLGTLVRFGYFDPTTRHNVAQPFYDFFNRNGTVFDGNGMTNGKVFDWVSTVGYPVTEPYWIVTKIGGIKKDVLVQFFERRALTFTPSNVVDFQVEMANVGRHYFNWRYDTRYDLAVPPSINGTINPTAGLPGAKFVMRSRFFQQSELIDVQVISPEGNTFDLPTLQPVSSGQGNAFGDVTLTITTQPASPLGLYQVIFTGQLTGNIAKFNFLLYSIADIVNRT